jgi:ketosteroid isomerase-like protein
MRNVVSIFLLFSTPFFIYAQDFSDPKLQSLVDAERAFINMAKEKNTRDAFIYFLADDAVTFGKGPRIGKKHLEAQTPNDSWLFWEPVYSDISSSSDFGFNTGPWEFRKNRTDEKAIAFGTFTSVWKKQLNGEWKVIIDIGISHPQPDTKQKLTTSSIPLKRSLDKSLSDFKNILDEENKFISAYTASGDNAYKKTLSKEARILRSDKFPSTVKDKLFSTKNGKVIFTPTSGDIASSRDLAFVYGTAKFIDNNNSTSEADYMHIWKNENKHWKIVLEVISNR